MLLVSNPSDPKVLMAYQDAPGINAQYWADLPSAMCKTYGEDSIEPISSTEFSSWDRSDHISFIREGYLSSLFAFENGGARDIWYHKDEDTWNNGVYDYETATKAVMGIGAGIAFTMSRAYGELEEYYEMLYLSPGRWRDFYIAISTPTTINVTSRWFSGWATFGLFDPDGNLIDSYSTDGSHPWNAMTVFNIPVTQQGIYRIIVYNQGGSTTGYELYWNYDSDVDSNGVPDSQEWWISSSYFSMDTDQDTISDGMEMILGTSWTSSDSDSDLLPDNYEIQYGLDPLNPSDAALDSDGDSLTNLQEFQFGSNPLLVDSDGDGLPDSWEYKYGLSPLVNDSQDDPDNDHLTNIQEYQDGTDPIVSNISLLSSVIVPSVGIGASVVLIAGIIIWYHKYR